MAASTQGTAHLYGISAGVASVTDATVLSFSLGKSHQNTAQTANEIGNEIERRYDDLHEEGTLTLRPRSGFTPLTVGGTYTYDSVEFEVVSETNDEVNQGHQQLTYAIKKSEYITYA
jgi:hypothetical protein